MRRGRETIVAVGKR